MFGSLSHYFVCVQCVCSQNDLGIPNNNATGLIRLVARENSLYVYTKQLGWVKVNKSGATSRKRRDTRNQRDLGNKQHMNTNKYSNDSNRNTPLSMSDSDKPSKQQLLASS